MKTLVHIDQVINLLNELNKIDSLATRNLFESRVYCKKELEDHPSIVTMGQGPVPQLGILGIINGFFGPLSNGTGPITAVYTEDEKEIIRFERTKSPLISPSHLGLQDSRIGRIKNKFLKELRYQLDKLLKT